VALPADKPNSTVTFFYSGDGGWRDLDRDVGGMMAKQGYPVVGIDTLRYFWSSKKADRVAADLSSLMQQYRSVWKAKHFVLAGYSFGADILPAVYNHLPRKDKNDVKLLVLLALGKTADFEIHVSGWIEKNVGNLPILPELQQVPGKKILCIYGQEEKNDSACPELSDPKARIIELPGGHHFHHDYRKLTQQLIDVYNRIKTR
jgi:type IV secretory pathway VirJ component